MPNQLFEVQYQVVAVDPNSPTDGTAYLYRRAVQEASVVAPGGDGASLMTVILNNITLQTGESVEIVQVEATPYGTNPSKPLYQ